jgi:hypothetical protein
MDTQPPLRGSSDQAGNLVLDLYVHVRGVAFLTLPFKVAVSARVSATRERTRTVDTGPITCSNVPDAIAPSGAPLRLKS